MGRRAKPSKIECKYVGKGGLKLEFALQHFELEVRNVVAADFGSHQGGFVDCLLQHHAGKVYAVDTCYGTLAWTIRQNPRVVVCERTNALYWHSPEKLELITIDVGWTRQRLVVSAASKNLLPGGTILSLLKPQYEMEFTTKGIVPQKQLQQVIDDTTSWLRTKFAQVATVVSPHLGSGGNTEVWYYLKGAFNGKDIG